MSSGEVEWDLVRSISGIIGECINPTFLFLKGILPGVLLVSCYFTLELFFIVVIISLGWILECVLLSCIMRNCISSLTLHVSQHLMHYNVMLGYAPHSGYFSSESSCYSRCFLPMLLVESMASCWSDVRWFPFFNEFSGSRDVDSSLEELIAVFLYNLISWHHKFPLFKEFPRHC